MSALVVPINPRETHKSMESLYSASSVNSRTRLIQRKTQQRTAGLITGSASEVRQRVQSARVQRLKHLQNQLNEALQNNAALVNENRLLKALHKRQDSALAKYESSNAELPQLLKSHHEEVRVWKAKYQTLHAQNRELSKKTQQKDTQIIELTDHNKKLTQLSKEKNLEEREALSRKVQYLEARLLEKEEEIKVLNRRNHLTTKNFNTHLSNEQRKYKELLQKVQKSSGKRQFHSYESIQSSANDSKGGSSDERFSDKPSSSLSGDIEGRGNAGHYIKESLSSFQTRESNDLLYKNHLKSLTPVKSNTGSALNVTGDEDKNGIASDADDDDLIIKRMDDKEPDESVQYKSNNESVLGMRPQITDLFAEMKIHGAKSISDIQEIQDQIRKGIQKDEALLDQHCNEINKDIEAITQKVYFPPLNLSDTPIATVSHLSTKKTKIPQGTTKRPPIDPEKKTKLLAALKSIDSNDNDN